MKFLELVKSLDMGSQIGICVIIFILLITGIQLLTDFFKFILRLFHGKSRKKS
jgi:hypothetical protein